MRLFTRRPGRLAVHDTFRDADFKLIYDVGLALAVVPTTWTIVLALRLNRDLSEPKTPTSGHQVAPV